jgi:hypothetical protein
VIAQLNFEGIWGSPVELAVHENRVALVLQSGLCRPVGTAAPGCAYSSGPGGNVASLGAVPAPLQRGVWHELVVHVHWAADATGSVDVWHRLRGARAWSRTASVSGYPTVQWAEDGVPGVEGAVTADKFGAYRGSSDFPLTIWEDGFLRAWSFAAASAALP